MFLCKECLSKRGEDKFIWEFELRMGVSYGPCEDCNVSKPCLDINHSLLKKVA